MTKHKGIKRIGKQKYKVRVVATDRRTGRRKDTERTCKGTLSDALALRHRLREELAEGSRERMTLGDYSKSWMMTKAPTLKRSTRVKYVRDLRLHILPELGDVYVDALRPMDIREFITRQLNRFEGNTVRNQLAVLRQLAADAVSDDLCDRDFCARVKAPSGRKYTEEDPNLLTAAELDKLIGHVPPHWYPLFAALAFTGLRWGEVAALRWKDIDVENEVIRVRASNWKGHIDDPKNRASFRSTALPPTLREALAEHRRWMDEVDHRGRKSEFVFTSQRYGKPFRGTPLSPVIKRAMRKAEINKRLTPHGLRRTFNDLVRRVAQGRVVRSMIGHSSAAMTDHYSMVDLGEKRAAADAALGLVSASRIDRARSACVALARLLAPLADPTVQRATLLELD